MKPTYSHQNESRPRRSAQKADVYVAQRMAAMGFARVQSAAKANEAWQSAIGERFKKVTRPSTLNRGVFEVLVANSAVLQELTFQKKKILKKLVAALPDAKIEELKFRVAAID